MITTLAAAFCLGVVAGFAMVPIYRRAFQTTSYYWRVLWAVPTAAIYVLSLAACLWLVEGAGELKDPALLVWLAGFVPGGIRIRRAYLSRARRRRVVKES